jgi:hypothetical protein
MELGSAVISIECNGKSIRNVPVWLAAPSFAMIFLPSFFFVSVFVQFSIYSLHITSLRRARLTRNVALSELWVDRGVMDLGEGAV